MQVEDRQTVWEVVAFDNCEACVVVRKRSKTMTRSISATEIGILRSGEDEGMRNEVMQMEMVY